MIPSPAGQERASLKEKVAFVYLLRNLEGRFYLGWTTDIKRRYEEFPSIDEAKRRERALKDNPRMLKFFKKRALATLRVSAALQQTCR